MERKAFRDQELDKAFQEAIATTSTCAQTSLLYSTLAESFQGQERYTERSTEKKVWKLETGDTSSVNLRAGKRTLKEST